MRARPLWRAWGLVLALGGAALALPPLEITDVTSFAGGYLIAFKNSFTLGPVTVTPKAGVALTAAEVETLQRDLARQDQRTFTLNRQFNGTRNSQYRVTVAPPDDGNPRIRLDGFVPGLETGVHLRETFLPGGKVKLENIGPPDPETDRRLSALTSIDVRMGLPGVQDLPLLPGQVVGNAAPAGELVFGGGAVVTFLGQDADGTLRFSYAAPATPVNRESTRTETDGAATLRLRQVSQARQGTFELTRAGALQHLSEVLTTTFMLDRDTPQYHATETVTGRIERTITPQFEVRRIKGGG